MKNPIPKIDASRGAPMGRVGERVAECMADRGPFTLVRVPLNTGGYDRGGAYWGIGAPLYYFEGPSGVSGYVRGRTRELAKREVLAVCPSATFKR